jgi:arylsulfatase A-like enzyme
MLLAWTPGVIASGNAGPPKPNFLILHTDDQRPDTLRCYNPGTPIKTPHIDSLATTGIRFTNGFVTTPICAVSRATLLTGRYARNARVHEFNVPIPEDIWGKSYPALLRDAGYFVGQLGKYGVGLGRDQKETFQFFDATVDQGPPFRDYHGERLHDAEWLTRRTKDFLDAVPKDKPFVLQVNYKEPHASSVPAPEDLNKLDSVKFERRANETQQSHDQLPRHVRNGFGSYCYVHEVNLHGDNNGYLRRYHEKILSVDRSVGAILAELRARGLLENTVVFFLSDHGAAVGEKKLGGKWTPYEESLRIPFIVTGPPVAKSLRGTTNARMVVSIDVAPTLLQLASLPIPDDMDGASLVPLLSAKDIAWRDTFFFEHRTSPSKTARPIPRSVGVRGIETKLFRWNDADPQIEVLHDLKTDPLEEKNLVDAPTYAEERKRLVGLLEAWLKRNPDTYTYDPYGPRPQSGAPEIDWERFQKARPADYARIKSAIETLNVTWEQATGDPAIREKVSGAARYWY